MNNMIVLPLLFIACLAGFYQLFTISTINYSGTQNIPTISYASPNPLSANPNVDQQYRTKVDSQNTVFSVEMTSGVIALIIGLTAIAVVSGVKLFGSGLSETSIKIIYNSTVYYGLWGIFSALSYPMFLGMPLFIGVFGWFFITLIYSLGYFESTWSHGS